MSTIVERTYRVDAPPEDMWELIADPALRAEAISVVDHFEQDGEETIWYLKMPIRAIPGTIKVRTRDVERDPPRYVRFAGTSSIMDIAGEHEIAKTDSGCTVKNRFRVEGKFPGVERFFEKNIDKEMENMTKLATDRLAIEKDE